MKSYFFFLLLLLSFSSGCKEEKALPDIAFSSFLVQGLGEFNVTDSVFFAVHSDSSYAIRLITQPEAAAVHLSFNDQPLFLHPTEEWITISPAVTKMLVYTPNNGYRKNTIKTIRFGYGQQQLLEDFRFYPNPVVDSVTFQLDNKTRGALQINIFDVSGTNVHSLQAVKREDSLRLRQSLASLQRGIYIVQIKMGDTTKGVRLLKH